MPLDDLPLQLLVPGRGFFHLIARTFDVAGQLAVRDAKFFTDAPCRANTPPPPPGPWQQSADVPGFEFKARLGTGPEATLGVAERDCLGETLCLSGSLAGRSELFVRIIGPRPNGFLWVNLVRFTTAEVEVWVQRRNSRELNYYRLPALDRDGSALSGLVDKEAFFPSRASGAAPRWRSLEAAGVERTLQPPSDLLDFVAAQAVVVTSPAFPGYRFRVRILGANGEVAARSERDCLPETICISGAVPGRSEVFLRLIGPRPNGYLWANLVRFTTSRVEVEIEQLNTSRRKTYVLQELPREGTELTGLVDREAFRP